MAEEKMTETELIPEPEKDIAEEKVVVPEEENADDSNALEVTKKAVDTSEEKGESIERDASLERLESEKSDDSKAIVVTEKAIDTPTEKEGSIGGDASLERLESEKADDSKALVVTEKAIDTPTEKGGLIKRDTLLERLESEKADDSKAPIVTEKAIDNPMEKGGPIERDVLLERLESEKRILLINAWEENEKARLENKAFKKQTALISWEISKKASLEAELKKNLEELERKKVDYAEKIKNKITMLHKTAKEKSVMIEAKKGEDLIKTEVLAAKYRAKGITPKKLGIFGA